VIEVATAQQKKFAAIARSCMGEPVSGTTLGGAMRAYGKCVKGAWRGRKKAKKSKSSRRRR
jgi:hypothetical protein